MKKPAVLIVEDEFLIAATLEDELHDLGCEVVGPISNGPDAIEALRTREVNAAFVDLDVVLEHRFDVAQALSEKNIPFGFATGRRQADLPFEWQSRPFLTKPFGAEEVKRFLREILPAHNVTKRGQS